VDVNKISFFFLKSDSFWRHPVRVYFVWRTTNEINMQGGVGVTSMSGASRADGPDPLVVRVGVVDGRHHEAPAGQVLP
jgi:hypothetical protein